MDGDEGNEDIVHAYSQALKGKGGLAFEPQDIKGLQGITSGCETSHSVFFIYCLSQTLVLDL